jgi:hypothetical protein
MREKSYRFCMLVGGAALGAVAVFYFVGYVELKIALNNNGLQPSLQQSIEGLWLAFAFHGLLIALLYLLVAFRPRAVSREVIVLLGLIQLVEAVLLFALAGNRISAVLLALAALFVLMGARLWPKASSIDESSHDEAPLIASPPPALPAEIPDPEDAQR